MRIWGMDGLEAELAGIGFVWIHQETLQLCHGPDHGEGDCRAEVQIPGSEGAVHIV